MGSRWYHEREYVSRSCDHSWYNYGLLPIDGWTIRNLFKYSHPTSTWCKRYGFWLFEYVILLVFLFINDINVCLSFCIRWCRIWYPNWRRFISTSGSYSLGWFWPRHVRLDNISSTFRFAKC